MNQWKTWCVAVIATIAAGCGGFGGGRTWVPQGPGELPETRAQREPAPRASPPAQAARAAPSAQPAVAAPAAAGGYTQATRYGDLLFISGQIAIEPVSGQLKGGNAEEQTRQVMENIRAILESHRLTMANVVSATVYLKDLSDFRAMDNAYEAYFRSALPARSVVEVARLPRSALVEISVIAGR